MATTARGIVYPTTSTVLTPLSNHFANLASSADTAIGNAVAGGAAFRGLDAAKGAAGQEGRTYYSTDTNRLWFDDGSNWISADAGMYLIRPSTVTNGTTDSSGTVIPNVATSVSLDFGSLTRFRTLKVMFYFEGTAADTPRMYFRRSGSNLQAAGSYKTQRLRSNGALVAGDYAPEAYTQLGAVNQPVTAGEIIIHNVGESATYKSWLTTAYQGPTNPQTINNTGLKDDSEVLAAIDGLTFSWISGTTFKSGAKNYIKVYGLA